MHKMVLRLKIAVLKLFLNVAWTAAERPFIISMGKNELEVAKLI